MTAPIRVVIAEDSAILRDGLVQLLVDRGFEVSDAVSEPGALHGAVERAHPDVAIVDIRMPPTFTDEGLRAAIDLRRLHKGLGILLFSQYIETRYASELLADDAAGIGYLLKDRVADVSEFVEALTRVASGGTALDQVVTQLLGASRRTGSISVLSSRERGPLPHGGRSFQRGHRRNARDLGRHRREARGQHLHRVRLARVGVRPSPGPRRVAIPRLVTRSPVRDMAHCAPDGKGGASR